MRLLGHTEDRDGNTTNNGLRLGLANDVETHQIDKDTGFNSGEWRAELAGAAVRTREEMASRARNN